MWLFEIIGAIFFGLFLFLIFGAVAVFLDYKQESEMGARFSETLDGEPPKKNSRVIVKDGWLIGLEKLGIHIEGVEDYERELKRDLRELMNITLPDIASMPVGVDMKLKYGGVVKREIIAVIERVDEERAQKAREEIDFLMEYGLGERAKN